MNDRLNADSSGEPTTGEQLMRTAKTHAKSVSKSLARSTGEAIQKMKEEGRRQADRQKDELVTQLQDVTSALTASAEHLENPTLGRQMNKMAHRLDLAASQIEQAEWSDLKESVEDFSRSQTTAFLTGSFALGLLAARFLRASRPPTSEPIEGLEKETSTPEVTREHIPTGR